MEATMQDIYLTIPSSDMNFFQQLIKKMGWKIPQFIEAKFKRHYAYD